MRRGALRSRLGRGEIPSSRSADRDVVLAVAWVAEHHLAAARLGTEIAQWDGSLLLCATGSRDSSCCDPLFDRVPELDLRHRARRGLV